MSGSRRRSYEHGVAHRRVRQPAVVTMAGAHPRPQPGTVPEKITTAGPDLTGPTPCVSLTSP